MLCWREMDILANSIGKALAYEGAVRSKRARNSVSCVAQKRRGTLPRLSQTGEGFLFGFDFNLRLAPVDARRLAHRD